jgi:hypothetical protein
LGLLVKSLIGDWVAGEFLFYKFGYDNCVMTFGALLTAFCLQILSPGKDLFSGMDAVIGFRSIPKVLSDASMNRCIQLLVFLLVALLTTLLTGRIAAEIKAKRAKGESFLAFMSTLIGLSELSLYVLILVSKG